MRGGLRSQARISVSGREALGMNMFLGSSIQIV